MAVRKRTLLEIDRILQRATAQRLHARTDEPGPDNLLFNKHDMKLDIGHLSDARTGLHVRKSEYNSGMGVEAYPVAEARDDSMGIQTQQVTAGVPDSQVARPAYGEIYEINAIRIAASVLAAGREVDILYYDGTNNVPLFQSGIGAWASGADFLIWPVDMSTYMTGGIAIIGHPPLQLTNGTYLYIDSTGLAAAETFDVYVAGTSKMAGHGLRQ